MNCGAGGSLPDGISASDCLLIRKENIVFPRQIVEGGDESLIFTLMGNGRDGGHMKGTTSSHSQLWSAPKEGASVWDH